MTRWCFGLLAILTLLSLLAPKDLQAQPFEQEENLLQNLGFEEGTRQTSISSWAPNHTPTITPAATKMSSPQSTPPPTMAQMSMPRGASVKTSASLLDPLTSGIISVDLVLLGILSIVIVRRR